MEALGEQGVPESEHERGVRVRSDRQPLRVDDVGSVVPDRGDGDERAAVVPRRPQSARDRVVGDPAGFELRVLQGDSAEHHPQLRVLGDDVPAAQAAVGELGGPEHMGQDHRRGPEAVVAHLRGVAAERVEETVELGPCVVEATGARPAVGATEDRGVPVLGPHPIEFGGCEVEGFVPVDLDEGIGSAALTVPVCAQVLLAEAVARSRGPPFGSDGLEPRPPRRGTADAQPRVDGLAEVGDHRARVRVARFGNEVDKGVVGDDGGEGSPVRTVRDRAHGPLRITRSCARARSSHRGCRRTCPRARGRRRPG
ncbi:Uncharacterised protein [Mycobacteroides abscessus subsp. abscessus]|nr:Uncharacterised protein [Mycobacteroides abscessus subsp. abscessus]